MTEEQGIKRKRYGLTEEQMIKLKQYGLLAAGFLGSVILLKLFLTWLVGDEAKKHQKPEVYSIPSVTQNVEDTDVIMHQFDKKLTTSLQKEADLEKQLAQQQKDLKEQQDLIKDLNQKVSLLEQGVQQFPKEQENMGQVDNTPIRANTGFSPYSEMQGGGSSQADQLMGPPIQSISLNLAPKKKVKTVDTYIPATSFVQATVLAGAYVSTGLHTQSDPPPILFKITSWSYLPNYVRKNMKACDIIGSAKASISSERVEVRTEKISCVHKNGRIFEAPIEAYIAGEDGNEGVHGRVIRREGDLLWNSFLAGTVSGLGKSSSQALGTTSISAFGATTSVTGKDVLKSGAYGGIGEGSDRLEKYFIDRAEQYQPVIGLNAGREVTIIFTKGLSLDELTEAEK